VFPAQGNTLEEERATYDKPTTLTESKINLRASGLSVDVHRLRQNVAPDPMAPYFAVQPERQPNGEIILNPPFCRLICNIRFLNRPEIVY